MEERWFGEFAKLAIVSAMVAREGRTIGFLYREAPDRPDDSGWRIMAGDETQEYMDDAANAAVLPLRDLLERDPALEPILRESAPSSFERLPTGTYRRIPG
jgi:hypothetical protein